MKYLLIIFFPIILFGQNSETILKDFNNDGYIDTLNSYYDGGSGFGGTYVTLINGKTDNKVEFNDFGCFCDIKKIILIPPKLTTENYKPFIEVIKKELLPKKKNVPDASLQWLITANINNEKLSNNTYYDLIINSPTIWIPGEIELPSTYYIDIKGDTLRTFYHNDEEPHNWNNSTENEGWLVYYGHNHFRNKNGDTLIMTNISSMYKVFKTSHGIILKKDNSYAWVFVSDYRLTGGPQKLRWESIGHIEIIEKYIIVQLINSSDFSNPIFIIDIENGISGRLRTENDYNKCYKTDNSKIIIENSFGSNMYELEELFKELEKTAFNTQYKKLGR